MSTGTTTEAPKMISTLQAVNQALDEAMANDERVIVFGEDVADPQGGGVFKTSKGLSTKYGDHRVRSTPIAEQAIVGAAVGAALAGMRPVAEIMLMNFITVAMDQLVNHAAKLRFMSGGQSSVPLTIRTIAGAGRGNGGQHSDMLEAWLAHVPGLKVVTASNPADAKGLLLSCIEDDNPCIFIEHIMGFQQKGVAPPPGHRVPLGKAAIAREGHDITVVSYGKAVNDVLAVAAALDPAISVEVIDLRTIAPFDEQAILESVGKTGRCLIVHEAIKGFGVGAEIAARVQEKLWGRLKAPVGRVGSKYAAVPFAPPLEKAFLYSQLEIQGAIQRLMAA